VTDDTTAPASITEFFTMVSAGLTSDPHMISATVVALSRLFFEFHAALDPSMVKDLLDTIVVFLRSNTREVTKSTFGFIKVALVALPPDQFSPYLAEVVPVLLEWSTDHKNHFNLKARHILERLIRKFSYDTVASFAQEKESKVLANIRKRQLKAKRQTAAMRANAADGDAPSDTEEPKQTFKSAFEEVLYGEEVSGEEDSDGGARPAQQQASRKRGKQQHHLKVDEDNLGDLLDRGQLGNVSGWCFAGCSERD
jgi:ribosomal RNA-processing protein 12